MNTEKELIINKMNEFSKDYRTDSLPSWEQLPNLDLYMDQVIFLLNQYSEGEMATVTQSMINNYVKLKAIPAPVKKKYSKIHLAYLIVFCTLKQTLSISTIQKIMPVDLDAEEAEETYKSFLKNRKLAFDYTASHTKKIKDELGSTQDMVMQISNMANIFKFLTEKLLSEENNKNQVI